MSFLSKVEVPRDGNCGIHVLAFSALSQMPPVSYLELSLVPVLLCVTSPLLAVHLREADGGASTFLCRRLPCRPAGRPELSSQESHTRKSHSLRQCLAINCQLPPSSCRSGQFPIIIVKNA